MRLLWKISLLALAALIPIAATALTIPNSFSSGTTASATAVNDNFTAVDTAVDALEAHDTTSEMQTAEGVDIILATEIDTFAKLNTLSSDTDAVLDTDIGSTVQAYDADLTDLADGSLSGSKVGTGLDITTATAGTLATARMHTDATLDSEWDSAAKINAATTDTDFVTVDGTHDLEITGSATFSGTLQGLVATTLVSASTHAPNASALGGGLFQCTNASGCDVTLPTAVSGYNACWYDNNGGGVITIDAAAGDEILLDGVPNGVADAIDSAGARGDFVCILALDATYWVTLGRSGTFVDGGAD